MAGEFVVECVRLREGSSGWLTVGKTYAVIEVLALPDKHVRFRVMADDRGTPILVSTELFAPTAPQALPPGWGSRLLDGGAVKFGPTGLLADGFWERLIDGDGQARATFASLFPDLAGP